MSVGTERHKPRLPRPFVGACVVLLLVIAGLRVADTHSVFSHTYDEPAHIATGMELLDRRTYRYERLHPPLERMAAAWLPWIDGARSQGEKEMWTEGQAILHARGEYLRELTNARLGILPFFLLGALGLWLWAREAGGDAAALVALLVHTNMPMTLTHAGLATTDTVLAAFLILALYAGTRWLVKPTAARALLFGLAAGFAVVSKFSAVLFLPAAMAAIASTRLLESKTNARASRDSSRFAMTRSGVAALVRSAIVAGLAAGFAIWIGYGARTTRLTTEEDRPHSALDERIPLPGPLRAIAYAVVELPIPVAPEFSDGLRIVANKNDTGHYSYLLGEIKSEGDWRYFPVGLFYKTPLPVLALALAGAVILLRTPRARSNRFALAPLAAALAILIVCIPSSINIGMRHVLPVVWLLAMPAAFAATHLWTAAASSARAKVLYRAATVALVVWLVLGTARRHPDYISYFNELAGPRPERILVNSDLDWGQDLLRLRDECRARAIEHLSIAYFGRARFTDLGLPTTTELEPNTPVRGWAAVSLCKLKSKGDGGYLWLEDHEPVARVGTSILLYRFDDETGPGSGRHSGGGEGQRGPSRD